MAEADDPREFELPDELVAEHVALLHAYREREDPDAVHRDRIWSRIRHTVGPLRVLKPIEPSRAHIRRWIVASVAAAAMIVVVAGLRGDWIVHRTERDPSMATHSRASLPTHHAHASEQGPGPVHRNEPAFDPSSATVPVTPQASDSDGSETIEVSSPVPEVGVSNRPRTKVSATRTTSVESFQPPPPAAAPSEPPVLQRPRSLSVAPEIELLERARAALSGGELDRALGVLDEHARLHPRGALVEEREGLRAVAHCRRGDPSHVGNAFLARYPTSPTAERVRQACRLREMP